MATEIKAWEIVDGNLRRIETTLAEHKRTEAQDLETWITSDPSILRPGICIIGRQVQTRSGPLDLLAIDRSGDLYVIELKRDRLPREVLAQAIDYASDVHTWTIDRIGETCLKYTGQSLEELFNDSFPDTDLESVTINDAQRILLVGFGLDASLERMIDWLSDQYGVSINALMLKYVKTASGTEILTTTSILSEEVERERVRQKKFTIPTSDEPGDYKDAELRKLLSDYLGQQGVTIRRIREVLIPTCLKQPIVSREALKDELVSSQLLDDSTKAGYALSVISLQLGMKKHDFLRQVIGYDYPKYHWEKDNYCVRPDYRQLVIDVLADISTE